MATSYRSEANVLLTRVESDLDAITSKTVQAVVYIPPALPAWFAELGAAVESGRFQIPRAQLPSASPSDIEAWLNFNLPLGAVDEAVTHSFKADVLRLVDRLSALTFSSRLMLRIFTEAPTTECGFHVDTVPRGASVYGLLRVYNGAGTQYVEAGDLIGAEEFYHYLGRRERLARDRREARAAGDFGSLERTEQAIADLDRDRTFMRAGAATQVASAGSIVAFKHVDIGVLWSSLPRNAWVHCSPMEGEPRLVVNLAVAGRTLRSARRAEDRIAR